jgi:hypothetical protein
LLVASVRARPFVARIESDAPDGPRCEHDERRAARTATERTRDAPGPCSAGTSRLSRRSERTRHALDSMPRPVGAVWSGSRRAHSWPRPCDPVAGVWRTNEPDTGVVALNRRRGINPAAAAIRTNPSPGAGPWPGGRIAFNRARPCARRTEPRRQSNEPERLWAGDGISGRLQMA